MNLIELCKKMPAPQAGKIIIAIGARGAVPLLRGNELTWGERLLGKYNEFYLVDISMQQGVFNVKAPSLRSSMHFCIELSVNFRISDPIVAVQKNISDPLTLMKVPLQQICEELACTFDIKDAMELRGVIRDRVLGMKDELPITIDSVAITVTPDADAAVLIRKIDKEELERAAYAADFRLDDDEREKWMSLLESPEKMYAEYLRTGNDKIHEMLMTFIHIEMQKKKEIIENFSAALEAGTIEPHEYREYFRDIMGSINNSEINLVKKREK
ncbi:hypothetical protein WI697_05245 [Tistrella mobilis]|uniref:hypothetical protein n=1 Tax=Tistrella mobilis TaxID=171437 RepID=UPI0031F6E980